MATKFSEVYNKAILKFSDYDFLDIFTNVRDDMMQGFLISAIVDFKNSCAEDLTNYDLSKQTFNVELDDEIQEILALGISYHWVRYKTLNSELLRNSMTHKDFTTYSPANLLKELTTLKNTLKSEFRGKVNEYSYRYGNLATIKAGDFK